MDKFKVLLLIICFLEAIAIGFLLSERNEPVTPPDVRPIEIVRDSIIRDSIFIEIEKVKTEIVYINEQFANDSSNIMSADDSTLFSNYTRYIEDYNNKRAASHD